MSKKYSINAFYLIAGIENGCVPFSFSFSLSDLMNNEGPLKNSELFYALQELHAEEIMDLQKYKPMCVRTNRDNEECLAVITRTKSLVKTETSFE